MRNSKNVLMSLLVLFCVACSPIKPVATEPMASYALNGVSTKKFTVMPLDKTILVSNTVASPGYQSVQMIYIEKPYHLEHFTLNRWVAPPSELLQSALVQSLRNTNHFHAVVTVPFSGVADYRLESQLLKFQQDFIQIPSQIELIFETQLIDNETNKVIASKEFSDKEKTTSDDPYGGVIAANLATSKIMSQISAFVVQNAHNNVKKQH